MGHHCCVPDCSSNSKVSGTGGLTFHAFPMDPKERKQWILSVRRADYKKLTVNKHTKVCSRHFRDEDFIQSQGSKRRMLKKGVVPSIFTWTNENQKVKDSFKKMDTSSNESGELSVKGSNKTRQSSDSKSSNGTKKSEEKVKLESSELSNIENMDKKTNNRNMKKDSDNCSEDISTPHSSYGSPIKSDDSEHSSISDLTATNGSSPVSSTNGTSRKTSTLNFQIGTRLEAKDLGNEMWYPVKVVEVDWDDEEILIHFEKWSQRYDEWVPMDSSRLRPSQNPTPQTDSKNSSKVFNIGDRVMAKWSDCRRYPAKVKAILGNDRYEVLFFDGFTKNIKGIRMTKLEGEIERAEEPKPEPPEKEVVRPVSKPVVKNAVIEEAIGTKEERRERKRKINVAELFHPKKRIKLDTGSMSPKSGDSEKVKKIERGRRRKENQSQMNESVDNEGEKSPVSQDTNGSVEDSQSIQGSELEVALEEKKIIDDGDDNKRKKKSVPRSIGGGEESADKPRRGLRQGETRGKTKSVEVKSYMRKFRKISPGGQESPSTPSKPRRDSSKGHVENNETPKGKKRDLSDESSKSINKFDQKEADKEEEKWIPDGQDGYIVESADGPRKTTVIPDKKLPSGWSKHSIQRKHGNSAGKWDVFLVNPQGRRFRSRHELRQYFEENGETFKSEMFDFCLSGKRRSRYSDGSIPGVRRRRGPKPKLHTGPGGDGIDQQPNSSPQQQQQTPQQSMPVPPQRRVKTLLPKIRQISASQSEDDSNEKHVDPPSPPPPYTTTVASVPAIKIESEMLEGEVLVGGLKIQMDGSSYKCPKESCGKHFRKENLLQMHIKHYHPEYNKFMGSTPNVADLAYARTIGESIDDLMPKSRYSGSGSVGMAGTTYMEKMNRFETSRKSKSGVSIGAGIGKGGGGGGGGDGSPVPDKKKTAFKEKLQSALAMKKAVKGVVGDGEVRIPVDDTIGEIKEPGEERTNVTDIQENVPVSVSDSITTTPITTMPYREEKKEPQTTIKTLLPVIRSPSHAQDASTAERVKTKLPSVDEGEEYVEVIDVGTKQVQPAHTTHLSASQSFASSSQGPSVTKSLRTIRRRRLSDFHFEPLHKRRKIATKLEVAEDVDVVDDGGSPVDVVTTSTGATANGSLTNGKSTPTYRYSRKKTPIVHLEKLNVTTDSNGRVILSPSVKEKPESKLLETPAQANIIEQLRKEELINCTCGFMEEDGLMIQCDLCLCWQHGICNNIEKESDVPEKYVCPICINPYRQRKSKKYMHDQDWLKEGKLPSLSFRSKNETNLLDREAVLKRSHDLTGSLLQIQQVLHSLRVKVNIAGKPDHPKLYLWAKSWEKDGESSSLTQQVSESQSQIVTEGDFKEHLDGAVSCNQNVLKTDICPDSGVLNHKDIVPDTGISEKSLQESVNSIKEQCIESIQDGHNEIGVVDLKTEIHQPETDVRLPEVVVGETEANIEQQCVEETVITDGEVTHPVKMEENFEGEHTEQVVSTPNVETEIECSSNVECDDSKETLLNESHDSDTTDTSKHLESEIECKVEESNKDSICEIDKTINELSTDSNQITQQLEDEEKHKEITIDNNASVIEDDVQATIEVTDTDVTSAPEIIVNDSGSKLMGESKNLNTDEKPVDTDEVSSQLESHGLLHQALTNGSHATNSINNGNLGSQIDASGHPMLQLPICQSELMQFASTMADNLRVTESRPSAVVPVPVPEPPRAPQPEAPIDPVECRLLLLDHIDHFQQQIDTRLTMLEEQVAALESQDPDAALDEAHDHYPQTKQAIQMLLRDLLTMRKIAALN